MPRTVCLFISMVLFFKKGRLKLRAMPLTIMYEMTKFEAPIYNNLRNSWTTIFQYPNSQRVITLKKAFFLEISPSNLLIILYMLMKLEAASYNIF